MREREREKVKWHVAKYGDPYSEISALHLTHPKCTHIHREHTPGAVGSHLCCGARGAVWGQCLAQGHLSRGIEGGRERWTFTPPTYNSCRPGDCCTFETKVFNPLDLQDILLQRTKLRKQFNKGISTLLEKLY